MCACVCERDTHVTAYQLNSVYTNYFLLRGQSWPNGLRVGLVTQRLRVRVSGPAGIVGGGSE